MRIFYRPAEYTKSTVEAALKSAFGDYEAVDSPTSAHLQLADYEELDFQAALDDGDCWICAYSIRKALIRKHFLSQTVREFVAKHPSSVLQRAVPETWNLEIDFVEFLDDALDESFELRGELEANEALTETERKWFILKPGMAERGAGLRLFSTIEELTSILEDNEPPEEDEEEDHLVDQNDGDGLDNGHTAAPEHRVMTSNMRFFVVQEYLSKPLLLPSLNSRKFHIRSYVLCVGSLQVYVHENMLVLSSAESYSPPLFGTEYLSKHLTNTCYQLGTANAQTLTSKTVHSFWEIEDGLFHKNKIWDQIKEITGQVFEAALSQSINFQTLPNAFEIFGLDYIVDSSGNTGDSLRHLVQAVTSQMIELVALNMKASITKNKEFAVAGDFKGYKLCLSKKMLS